MLESDLCRKWYKGMTDDMEKTGTCRGLGKLSSFAFLERRMWSLTFISDTGIRITCQRCQHDVHVFSIESMSESMSVS